VIPRCAVAHRVLSVAGAVCVLTVACGGSPERLTSRQYRGQASTHCETLKDASNELREAQAPSAVGKTVTRYLHGAADRLRELVDGLRELEPPESFETDADEMVRLLGSYAEGLDDLAARVRPGDTLQVTFEQNQKLVERLNGVAGDVTSLVTRLELTGCILSA
jgi:hypothetical protein